MTHSTTVYLLHFVRKLGNQDNPRGMAQHYIGFAEHDLASNVTALGMALASWQPSRVPISPGCVCGPGKAHPGMTSAG